MHMPGVPCFTIVTGSVNCGFN